MFILILILAILYTIAYGIIGIKYFILISLIAAIFSLIPYLGNIMGLVLAIGASAISGGGTGEIIAIVISFSVIQFVEIYILEPFVVGDKVDINPVIVIVGVVIGSLVWGVMGMILVIPILGIFKVIFDNIDPLRPLGYVLDERDVTEESSWVKNFRDGLRRMESSLFSGKVNFSIVFLFIETYSLC